MSLKTWSSSCVEEQLIEGLVTDGDLRRELKKLFAWRKS